MDRKAWQRLPATLPAATLVKLYRAALKDLAPRDLWGVLHTMHESHLTALVPLLKRDRRVVPRLLSAAYAEGGIATMREASAFCGFVRKSSHVPGALARMRKQLRPSTELSKAAAGVVLAQRRAADLLEVIEYWTLVWVAARGDRAVLAKLAQRAATWDATSVLERVENHLP